MLMDGVGVADVSFFEFLGPTWLGALRRDIMGIILTGDPSNHPCRLPQIVALFRMPEARVEAAVMLYNRLMNREQFWRVLKTLGPMEQALTIHRVGLGNPGVLPQQKNTMHYRYAPG